MYTSGFIGPSARSLAPVWPNICTRCHIDQVIALFCAVITYLCFIPEFYCFYQRKMEDFFHPEEKVTSEFLFLFFRILRIHISKYILQHFRIASTTPSFRQICGTLHPLSPPSSILLLLLLLLLLCLPIYIYIHASSLWV
jgi:hypothetical protein